MRLKQEARSECRFRSPCQPPTGRGEAGKGQPHRLRVKSPRQPDPAAPPIPSIPSATTPAARPAHHHRRTFTHAIARRSYPRRSGPIRG